MDFNTKSKKIIVPSGKILEDLILFQKIKTVKDFNEIIEENNPKNEKNPENNKKNDSIWWREPPEDLLIMEFCEDSTFHGLKFIAQKNRHLSERIIWTIFFLAAATISFYLITDLFRKYRENPIIVSFQPAETELRNIPFPAFTICNSNLVLKTEAEKIIQNAKSNPKRENLVNLFYLDHICSSIKSFSNTFNYSSVDYLINPSELRDIVLTTQENQFGLKNFLKKASQKCEHMIRLCKWQGEEIDCREIFKPIDTDSGRCCTFNMIPQTLFLRYINNTEDDKREVEEWSKWDVNSNGVLLNNDNYKLEFPKSQYRAGLYGLSILIDPDFSEYFCTSTDSYGFQVQAHLPIVNPHVKDYGVPVEINSEIYIPVFPNIIIADKNIRHFNLEKRQCFFSGEMSLKYYSYYTYQSCIDECIANQTYIICNCVRYYMPRDASLTLCGPKQFECAEEFQEVLNEKGIGYFCSRCKPDCNDLSYFPNVQDLPLQDPAKLWKKLDSDNLEDWAYDNVSIVHLYFVQDSIYAQERKELYGTIDLISNTGGLLSFCLGFSGMTAIEIIYYFTIRAICKIRRRRRDKLSI